MTVYFKRLLPLLSSLLFWGAALSCQKEQKDFNAQETGQAEKAIRRIPFTNMPGLFRLLESGSSAGDVGQLIVRDVPAQSPLLEALGEAAVNFETEKLVVVCKYVRDDPTRLPDLDSLSLRDTELVVRFHTEFPNDGRSRVDGSSLHCFALAVDVGMVETVRVEWDKWEPVSVRLGANENLTGRNPVPVDAAPQIDAAP